MTRIRARRVIAAITFSSLLLLALAGWTWVVARTLANERRVATAELEANQRKLLDRVARDLESGLLDSNREVARLFESGVSAETAYVEAIRRGLASGIVFDSPDIRTPVAVPNIEQWREGGGARIKESLVSGELSWGLDEEGRDPLAALIADLIRQDPDPELADLLRQRALDTSVALKPSFRLFLLTCAGGGDERVIRAEKLRAANGEVADVPEFQQAEISSIQAAGLEMKVYRTAEDLKRLVNGFPEGMRLGTGDGAAGYVKRIAGLDTQPFIQFSPRPQWFGKSDRMLGVVGVGSGLLLACLLLAGTAYGLIESRNARSRMDLAATVAHELRTPLAGQRLVLESLAADPGSEGKHRDYIAMALRENKRLCHLAEEFLTFSRLERGGTDRRRETVMLGEVFRQAVELMENQLKDGDFAMEVEDGLTLTGDSGEISTVIRNLVENAWKYSDGIPWIRLRARYNGTGVIVEVEDRGRGIARSEQARIFRQFHRGDRTLARRSDGIGLGLAIVRRIVDAHQGTIQVVSEPGRGSLFRIHFPNPS